MAIAITVTTVFWHVRLIAVSISHATLTRHFYLSSDGLTTAIRRRWWSWAGCIANSKAFAIPLAWVNVRRVVVTKAFAFFLDLLLATSDGTQPLLPFAERITAGLGQLDIWIAVTWLVENLNTLKAVLLVGFDSAILVALITLRQAVWIAVTGGAVLYRLAFASR